MGQDFKSARPCVKKSEHFLDGVGLKMKCTPKITGKIIEIDDKPLDRGVPYFQTNPYANMFSRL